MTHLAYSLFLVRTVHLRRSLTCADNDGCSPSTPTCIPNTQPPQTPAILLTQPSFTPTTRSSYKPRPLQHPGADCRKPRARFCFSAFRRLAAVQAGVRCSSSTLHPTSSSTVVVLPASYKRDFFTFTAGSSLALSLIVASSSSSDTPPAVALLYSSPSIEPAGRHRS